jgi:hypothetical protein
MAQGLWERHDQLIAVISASIVYLPLLFGLSANVMQSSGTVTHAGRKMRSLIPFNLMMYAPTKDVPLPRPPANLRYRTNQGT